MNRGDKVILVGGARPNFVKVAPLERALTRAGLKVVLVHTGQHYDKALSQDFFDQLGLPEPDYHLEVGSAGHGEQTGRVMIAFEPVVAAEKPDAVMVVGDVNSTLACALVSAKTIYPDGGRPLTIHVEAGLRSFDRTMPEEINRAATDHVSDLLLASEQAGVDNLIAEGIDRAKIHLVGNVMIDTLRRLEPRADRSDVVDRLGLTGRAYGLVTLHRPANVDRPDSLAGLVAALTEAGQKLPLLLAAHPRTQKMLTAHGIGRLAQPGPDWAASGGLALTGPLPYLDFLALMKSARVVLTDSGGIQEETTALGVPCITLRQNTERPVTLTEGTNQLARRPEEIGPALERALSGKLTGRTPELWDGKAAERIAELLLADAV